MRAEESKKTNVQGSVLGIIYIDFSSWPAMSHIVTPLHSVRSREVSNLGDWI